MKLTEEDRHFTTFITPYGWFLHYRGPMGFTATGDTFCLRGDMALQGVQNCVKVIDNLLLYDEDYITYLHHIHEVLTRCRKFWITLNKDKFVVVTPTVNFCGYNLSGDGISADQQNLSPCPPVLALFDQDLPTVLQTDVSHLNGIGYALLQDHGNGHLHLVQCGSHFLTDAEAHYATIKLEMLAIVSAMTKSVRRAGKLLCVLVPLSRAPVSYPTQEDEFSGVSSAVHLRTVIAMNTVTLSNESSAQDANKILQDLRDAARADPAYTRLLDCVTSGLPRMVTDGDLVLYGARVVVPATLRRRTLSHLHDSHRGVEATKCRARQSVFWPGIDYDIVNMVRAYKACQILQPSQQQESLINDANPTRPFESVSADFFVVTRKACLVVADRLSG
ncbi:uncharacterized protein [Palaemon carinicauda]|uniref:uncharacterized protein n=1 Tax=Palaemon carinicauda TaxID=392227 RepID=UPI0035B5DBAD